ncbi:hypothetical protein H5158_06315 [Pseudoalteromonas sp. SR45-6]|uniref:hypothetical protein n=1 Tax=Pseudoalteromonas sp. SR45-6 TaxID=2760927 RepID=UPI001602A3F8|nr:hypothetical protein [Pseudoalteromonas sp. SR45-6]MBB1341254.1 hypothetical protein [Pseudoalteromonas sp. SR45-6]
MSKKLIYGSFDSLVPVEKVLNEASQAIENKTRTTSDKSDIKEALAAAGGIGTGAGIGFAGLYFGGTAGLSAAGITSGLAAAGSIIGGGMVAGIAVLAAPAALLGVGTYAFVSKRNQRKLYERKELLLQEAMRKQNSIISELKQKSQETDGRISYLEKLNILLQEIINDLEMDIKVAA